MRLINKEGNGKVHKGKAMLIFLDMLDTPEEKNCFQIIYETYSHFLWYLADQILHDAHLAEDAVQETFLALANHMDRVKDPRSRETRNFLGTIVRNKAIDIVRRQKKIKVESYEEWEGQAGEDLLELYLQKESRERIFQAIDRLPEEYRIALEYRYLHEMSEKEVAGMMGISPKTANGKIFRARKKLQTLRREEEACE